MKRILMSLVAGLVLTAFGAKAFADEPAPAEKKEKKAKKSKKSEKKEEKKEEAK